MSRGGTKRVNLALQGGASHGAFGWGVLDWLAEDGRLDIGGVSAASAGSINAVVYAQGRINGGNEGARAALEKFWRAISEAGRPYAAATMFLQPLTGLLSPYQFNPFDLNPLREVLAQNVDMEALRACDQVELFVCATNVRSGRARVFREHELTCDMLLASAALPTSFRAVEIEGDAYWDGGYMGNPALYPLFYATKSRDLLLVQINPLQRPEVPTTPQDILERINEISFNASLLHELRAIAFVQRLLDEQRVDPRRYKRINLHMVEAEDKLRALGAATKSETSPAFIEKLFGIGRTAALDWLDRSIHYVGHASGVRIAERFL
jgi:NTE family protein